ncbi:MAG TPA: hypothetical protein VIJ28_10145 [Chloroflexota bacterium]
MAQQAGTGYSPFGTDTKIAWLGSARVIGDLYTTPERTMRRTDVIPPP